MGSQSIGLFSGKKVFSHKNLTAEIMDAGNKIYFHPVKYIVGDYFLAVINNQTYAFKIDGARIKTSDAGGTKQFSVIHYDIQNYLPISERDLKLLELTLKENNLPKVNNKMLGALKLLGDKEKANDGEFHPHELDRIIEKLAIHKDRYSKEITEILDFMTALDTSKIVTPVRRIGDFLTGDCKTVDAKFMGEIFTQAVKMDETAKKVLNPPLTAKKSYLIIILAIGIIGTTAGMGYFANEAGVFEGFGGIVPNVGGGGGGYDQATLMSKYPSGPALRAAVDSGELDYDRLPKNVQQIVDDTPSPVAVPEPPTIVENETAP